MQRSEGDVQQHDSLRDTVRDASEDQISSPHEYDEYSEREDRQVSLFRAQMSPELMQKYVEEKVIVITITIIGKLIKFKDFFKLTLHFYLNTK